MRKPQVEGRKKRNKDMRGNKTPNKNNAQEEGRQREERMKNKDARVM